MEKTIKGWAWGAYHFSDILFMKETGKMKRNQAKDLIAIGNFFNSLKDGNHV